MLKHYVTFMYPGSFVAEESSEEIKSRNDKLEIPKNCFAYYYWDREEQKVNGEVHKGAAKNKSGRFYFGELMSIKDVEEKVADNRILLSNMRCNNWQKVVKTRMGNFQRIEKGDIVFNNKL